MELYISLFKENMFTKILMEGLNIMLHKIFIDKIEFQSMTSFLYKKKKKPYDFCSIMIVLYYQSKISICF